MPVPGDIAYVRVLDEEQVLVERLEERHRALTRRTADGRAKTIAANVDTLVTVTALAQPTPRAMILDQLLAFAELEAIEALILLTKPDLVEASVIERWRDLYSHLGYRTLVIDPKHGTHVEELRAALQGCTSLLCGVSGVGKSSIFRALGGAGAVGELSRRGLGRQTTTTARLCRLAGGFLIDSPGVAEFGLGAITPRDLAALFVEMRLLVQACRFTDCTHLQEPGCAIREAVARGEIDASRYTSYRQILRLDPVHAMVQ